MVEVEIRTPTYNEELEQIELQRVALVRVDDRDVEVWGEADAVPQVPVMSLNTGATVHIEDDPEEWARSLPFAYRSGDLIAVVLRDDAAPAVDLGDRRDDEPAIPEPPAPVFDETETSEHAALAGD